VLGIIQALSGLVYWLTAVTDQQVTLGNAALDPKALVVGAAYFESFAAGLGTSAYLAFLMSVCEKRYAATQFALLSALLALTRWIAGDLSGNLAEQLGYANYFLLTFALGLPAFALIPRLRRTVRT
jgi:PAT family beta-lactamase induction signal transducer AmpG